MDYASPRPVSRLDNYKRQLTARTLQESLTCHVYVPLFDLL